MLLKGAMRVEGHVVDHHNVPPLKCWDQTLLYVSQKGLAIHGSFDQHRRHNASLTQASDKRHRLPVAHRCIADQALATRIPTVEPHHVGGHCCFIDKYEVGRVKKALLANPASACTRHVGSLALRRPQTFFDGDAMTGEEAGQRATTSWDTPLVKRRNNLIERKIPLRADECENLPRALLPRSVAGNVGTAAPSNPRSRQLPARKVLSLSTGSTHRKTSPSCGPVAMLSGSSIRLPTEAGNRTTRVLPNPDNSCATDSGCSFSGQVPQKK
jgi:hypothetical protein